MGNSTELEIRGKFCPITVYISSFIRKSVNNASLIFHWIEMYSMNKQWIKLSYTYYGLNSTILVNIFIKKNTNLIFKNMSVV